MSAEVESNFYFGEVPWHGLGIELDHPATAREAIQAASLDWTVTKEPISIASTGTLIPKSYATVRESDGKPLGVVGEIYTPLQNSEAFDFMDGLAHDGSMRYHVAGSLFSGEQVFILGKIGNMEIIPSDQIDNYILLVHSHNGQKTIRVLFTAVRVVCNNTVNLALQQGKKQGLSIKHTKNAKNRIIEAQKILGLGQKQFNAFEQFGKAATKIEFNTNLLNNFIKAVLPEPPEEAKRAITINEKTRDKLVELFESGTGTDIPGVAGTAWAAYNAVSEFTNYYRPIKGKTNLAEKRFTYTMLNKPAMLSRATQFILQYA